MSSQAYDCILLKELEFWGRHGASSEEQEKPQPFLVTLWLQVDLKKPCQSDQLDDTLDYALLYTELKQLFENKQHRLLEKLAQEVADIALKNIMVQAVTVRVVKLRAKVGDDLFCAAVEINRKR